MAGIKSRSWLPWRSASVGGHHRHQTDPAAETARDTTSHRTGSVKQPPPGEQHCNCFRFHWSLNTMAWTVTIETTFLAAVWTRERGMLLKIRSRISFLFATCRYLSMFDILPLGNYLELIRLNVKIRHGAKI